MEATLIAPLPGGERGYFSWALNRSGCSWPSPEGAGCGSDRGFRPADQSAAPRTVPRKNPVARYRAARMADQVDRGQKTTGPGNPATGRLRTAPGLAGPAVYRLCPQGSGRALGISSKLSPTGVPRSASWRTGQRGASATSAAFRHWKQNATPSWSTTSIWRKRGDCPTESRKRKDPRGLPSGEKAKKVFFWAGRHPLGPRSSGPFNGWTLTTCPSCSGPGSRE
jgi:hypothetical protein